MRTRVYLYREMRLQSYIFLDNKDQDTETKAFRAVTKEKIRLQNGIRIAIYQCNQKVTPRNSDIRV